MTYFYVRFQVLLCLMGYTIMFPFWVTCFFLQDFSNKMGITRFDRAEIADKERSLNISLMKEKFCDHRNLPQGKNLSENIIMKMSAVGS